MAWLLASPDGAAHGDQALLGLREVVVERRVERVEVLGEVGLAHLGPLRDPRRGQRDADRPGDVAQHDVERAGVAVQRPRHGRVGDGAGGHEQERQAQRLRRPDQRQRAERRVRRDAVGVAVGAAQREEAEADDVAGLDVGQHAAHHRDQQQQHQRARRQHQPGQRGGIAQPLLRQLRDEHRAGIQDGADREDHHRCPRRSCGWRTRAGSRSASSPSAATGPRRPGPSTASTAQTTMSGEPNQSSSSPRSSMICRLPRPERDQAETDIVEIPHARPHALDPGRVLHQGGHGEEGEDADGMLMKKIQRHE